MSDAFRLDGKVVVLTGAGGIIGSVVVGTLLEAGARVLALDRDDASLSRLGAEHDSLMLQAADVADSASLRAAHARLVARWGEADALLNNAATKTDNFFEPFETFPLADWNHIMGVNLTGAMLSAQVFGSPMALRGSGSIVNTLSIYGIVGQDQGIYEGSEYLGRKINTRALGTDQVPGHLLGPLRRPGQCRHAGRCVQRPERNLCPQLLSQGATGPHGQRAGHGACDAIPLQ
jgi:NAD(P)-dependent dehydrogenase (short-subunit alcohol dehydrogenase family)